MKFFSRNKKSDDSVRYITNITRSMSIMLDLIILICVLLASSYLLFILVGMFYSPPLEAIEKSHLGFEPTNADRNQVNTYYLYVLFTQIFQLTVVFCYITFMWYRFGTTPAKFLFGIRIVNGDTLQKITFKQATIRFFSIILSMLPLGLGFIWSMFDKRSQAWHDKIANTVLIIKNVE